MCRESAFKTIMEINVGKGALRGICSVALRSARAQAGGPNAPPLSYSQIIYAVSQWLPMNPAYSNSVYDCWFIFFHSIVFVMFGFLFSFFLGGVG